MRADHLSLYGYRRPTSPVLERLARWGIRFDEARATAPWTLPSHASMFTGRWPHELRVNWDTPLRWEIPDPGRIPGVSRLCDRRLRRQHHLMFVRQRIGPRIHPLRGLRPRTPPAVPDGLAGRPTLAGRSRMWGCSRAAPSTSAPSAPCRNPWLASLFIRWPRKDAGSINRAFLDWLSRRREPGRPFFAFLNYYDAHAPYVLPEGAEYRFGLKPQRAADFIFLMEEWETIDKPRLRPVYRELGRDSYDNCVAYLDERLGELLEELRRRRRARSHAGHRDRRSW